jgi:hypothetical protein
VNPALAAADAIPVRINAATVLGKDPYTSVVASAPAEAEEEGKEKGDPDKKGGEDEKNVVAKPGIQVAPAIPAAPVPVVSPGTAPRPLLIQPGKADIE